MPSVGIEKLESQFNKDMGKKETRKSKMSPGEGEERKEMKYTRKKRNEVYLGLPCGRQKLF